MLITAPDPFFSFFFYCYGHPRDLHSFPTRRSSDLARASRRSSHRGRSRALSFSGRFRVTVPMRSEEHTSELQSRRDLVCRLLLEKKKKQKSTGAERYTRHDIMS